MTSKKKKEPNLGVSAAIMTGIRAAETEIVCSIDSDCSYDPQQLEDLIPLMTEDVDVVTASPYHPDGKVVNVPEWRLVISRAASAVYRQIFRSTLHTYTSCFRVYRRSSVVDIDLENAGFVGVAELLWQVDQSGGRIVESPAELGIRHFGQSKMRIMEVALDHVRFIFGTVMDRLWRPTPRIARPSRNE